MEPDEPGWVDQVVEEIIDPDQRIIDPHHHLWPEGESLDYGLEDLHVDTGSGHRVEATVFVECHASYRSEGPEHLCSLGETEFVAAAAQASRAVSGQATIKGIVSNVDLRLDDVDAVLDAHEAAGQGLFRGVRHAIAFTPDVTDMRIPGLSLIHI